VNLLMRLLDFSRWTGRRAPKPRFKFSIKIMLSPNFVSLHHAMICPQSLMLREAIDAMVSCGSERPLINLRQVDASAE
jgi:hypothetical protein